MTPEINVEEVSSTSTLSATEKLQQDAAYRTVKSLANIEDKMEAIDWKLWEIYNMAVKFFESQAIIMPPAAKKKATKKATDSK